MLDTAPNICHTTSMEITQDIETFRILSFRLDAAHARVAKANKRAAKNGLAPFTLNVVGTESEPIKKYDEALREWKVVGHKDFTLLTLTGETVKIAGWTFLATLTHDEQLGNIVLTAPGFDGNLIEYRTATAVCDHCNLDRRRNETFVIENEAGERKQIGRNCLALYIGIDPVNAIRALTYWDDLGAFLREDDFDGAGGSGHWSFDTDWYLTNVCCQIRLHGYTPASSTFEGQPTRDRAFYNMVDYGKKDKGVEIFDTVTPEDIAQATAAREWILAEDKSQSDNEFEYNLWRTALSDSIPERGRGFLAYLPVAHAKAVERELTQKARKAQAADSNFVGEIKQRLVFTLTCLNVIPHEGMYGTSYITKLVDADGNLFTWFGSYPLEQGKTYTGKWTIKKHDDNEQYGKQTIINRPANLQAVEEVPA